MVSGTYLGERSQKLSSPTRGRWAPRKEYLQYPTPPFGPILFTLILSDVWPAQARPLPMFPSFYRPLPQPRQTTPAHTIMASPTKPASQVEKQADK